MTRARSYGKLLLLVVASIEQGTLLNLSTITRLAIPEAESSLRVVLEVLTPEDGVRTGGYLCVGHCHDGRISRLIHDPIGVIQPGKKER